MNSPKPVLEASGIGWIMWLVGHIEKIDQFLQGMLFLLGIISTVLGIGLALKRWNK